jgi:hypothetical protein
MTGRDSNADATRHDILAGERRFPMTLSPRP